MALPPKGLSVQVFEPLLGQSFILADGGSETALELVSARERPELRSGPEFRVPFFLEFKSSSPALKPQRIYSLRHATFGEIELFLVPLRRDATGWTYLATFN